MAKVLGIAWIVLGVLWFLKPEALRSRLKRKMSRALRFTVYGFLFFFGAMIVASVVKIPGILAKVIGLLGIILAIKGVVLMMSKASEKLWEWWLDRPLMLFRVQALIMVIFGMLMVVV